MPYNDFSVKNSELLKAILAIGRALRDKGRRSTSSAADPYRAAMVAVMANLKRVDRVSFRGFGAGRG